MKKYIIYLTVVLLTLVVAQEPAKNEKTGKDSTKTKKKKTKEPLSSKLKKLSEYTAKYEGKGWKNFIKEGWKKGKKEFGVDKETLLKKKKKVTKKSIGGETVVMKSGGGYIDDLL